MLLSAEQIDSFKRNGFLVFNPGLASSLPDSIVEELKPLYLDEKLRHVHNGNLRLQDAWKYNDKVRSLILNPAITSVLKQLYGREPKAFQSLNFPEGTEQKIHSDTIHFNSEPAGFMCGVWIALEDIDMENGPLVYYPGSHLLPEIKVEDIDAAGYIKQSFFSSLLRKAKILLTRKSSYGIYPFYENFIEDYIKEKKLKPSYGCIKKGKAIIWSSNLLHGGLKQADNSRTRNSQVNHYFFEGCKYYTPLHSFGSYKFWRTPDWVV